jgi:undecaprenyl phosphate N,N'-diacetylbacillosamine 1-phosphate transferase
MYKFFIKRTLDLIIAFVGLVIVSPILVIISIGLYFANSGKPFFFQLRPGKNAKLFKIVKFKTMNDKKDKTGNLLADAQRLTKIGAFVRKTSLDELPQLLNVLRGEMSLIGPRPLLPEYLPLYSKLQNTRHDLRPGITGWAQVNGRNALSWNQKFEYDVWYVDNMSFVLDIKIVLKTIQKVIKREGVNSGDFATMEAFVGNKD